MRGPRRPRWLRAQLRPPGSAAGAAALSLVLSVHDLPGTGWRQLDERVWRTGAGGGTAGWAVRARAAGSFTGWRSFEQHGARRWLWTQAAPLACEADATLLLGEFFDHQVRNVRAKVRVLDEAELDPPGIHADRARARAQTTTGRGGPGTALYLAWTRGPVLSVLAGSGAADGWGWDALARLADLQTTRIETSRGAL